VRITIITEDKAIGIDGQFLIGIEEDMSWIPNDVHAVQWYHDHGEVEYVDTRPNLQIESLGIYSKAITTFEYELRSRKQKEIDEELQFELTRDYSWELRNIRNTMLKDSDWVFLPDSPIKTEDLEAWITYRQLLRDFPDTIEDPKPYVNDLSRKTWPQPPTY
jgi:hypothetical protein